MRSRLPHFPPHQRLILAISEFSHNVSVSRVSCIVRLCVFAQSFNYLMSVMVFFSMYCIRFPLAVVHCMPVRLNLMPVLFFFSSLLCLTRSPVFVSILLAQKLQMLLYLITFTLTHRLRSLILILLNWKNERAHPSIERGTSFFRFCM